MLRNFIRNNITFVAIAVFILIFGFVQLLKPAFLYNEDGSVREFGVGYKSKTIMPVWLFSILLGILSYLFVMYYVHLHL
jgi:quinol-cytochrome oxidoreductase complex cytochrome b subunit